MTNIRRQDNGLTGGVPGGIALRPSFFEKAGHARPILSFAGAALILFFGVLVALAVISASSVRTGAAERTDDATSCAAEHSFPRYFGSEPRVPVKPRKEIRKGIVPDFSLQLSKARLLMKDGKYAEASALLELAVKGRPELDTPVEMLAYCYINSGRAKDAVALLEGRLKSRPASYSLIRYLGLAYIELGERDRAVEAWNRLLDNGEGSAGYYGVVARLEKESGLYEEAVNTLRRGKKYDAFRSRYTTELIKLERSLGREEDAFREALSALADPRDHLGTSRLNDAVDIIRSSGKKDRLTAIADSITGASGNALTFLMAKGILFAETERYDDAYRMVVELSRKKNGKDYIYNLITYIAQEPAKRKDKRFDRFFDKVLGFFAERYPDSAEAAGVLLVKADEMRKRALSEGVIDRAYFKNVLTLIDRFLAHPGAGPYTESAKILKAEVLIEDLHEPAKALEVLRKAIWKSKEARLRCEELTMESLIALGDWDALRKEFKQVASQKDSTFSVLGAYALGAASFYSGGFDDAMKRFSDLAKKYPWSKWANDALRFSLMIKKAEMAKAMRPLVMYRNSILLEKRGDFVGAIDSLNALSVQYRDAFIAPEALWDRARIEIEVGLEDAAVKDLQRITESYALSGQAPKALERLASLIEPKDVGEAVKYYSMILERYPDYPFIDRVRKRFIELRKSMPD